MGSSVGLDTITTRKLLSLPGIKPGSQTPSRSRITPYGVMLKWRKSIEVTLNGQYVYMCNTDFMVIMCIPGGAKADVYKLNCKEERL
jgi:hypothetical protein